MTYYDLIRSSLRLIGQLGPGRGPNNSEITDALFVMNSMLDAWTIEHLMVYTIERAAHPLTGAASYTIGPGGAFSAPRPVRIEYAGVIYTSDPAQEFPVPVTSRQRWARSGSATNQWTGEGVYYDNAVPLATLYLRPVPQNAASLALYCWTPLGQVVTESAAVVFPPGYADAIRYNLASRLCPEWGKVPRPDVENMAVQSKANIKSFNMQPVEMGTDPALACCGGNYNIYSDGY